MNKKQKYGIIKDWLVGGCQSFRHLLALVQYHPECCQNHLSLDTSTPGWEAFGRMKDQPEEDSWAETVQWVAMAQAHLSRTMWLASTAVGLSQSFEMEVLHLQLADTLCQHCRSSRQCRELGAWQDLWPSSFPAVDLESKLNKESGLLLHNEFLKSYPKW